MQKSSSTKVAKKLCSVAKNRKGKQKAQPSRTNPPHSHVDPPLSRTETHDMMHEMFDECFNRRDITNHTVMSPTYPAVTQNPPSTSFLSQHTQPTATLTRSGLDIPHFLVNPNNSLADIGTRQIHADKNRRKRSRRQDHASSSSEDLDDHNDELALDPALNSGASLPPLPRNVVSAIGSGKVVCFDKLLPHSSTPDIKDGLQMVPHRSGFSLAPKNRNKARVMDFRSWSVAGLCLHYTTPIFILTGS